jgi:hypothetical protein
MNKNKFPSFNSEQADHFIKLVKEGLGTELANIIDGSKVNMNHLVRFMHISKLCQARREEMGLSFKDISTELKIPQYRLKAIEGNSIQSIAPAIFDRYIEFLGLQDEFQEWLKENRDVYEEVGRNG